MVCLENVVAQSVDKELGHDGISSAQWNLIPSLICYSGRWMPRSVIIVLFAKMVFISPFTGVMVLAD